MRLKLSDIPEEHSSQTGTFDFGSDEAGSIEPRGRGVSLGAEINRTSNEVYFQISYAGDVQQWCSRCLSEFATAVKGNFLLIHGGAAPEIDEDEDDETDASLYVSDDWIDIGAAARDEIITGLPLKPLCSEDCSGGDCSPAASTVAAAPKDDKDIDPRWEALRKLKAG